MGTRNHKDGCEIWEYDGKRLRRINNAGFGDLSNGSAQCLCVYRDKLYAGTRKNSGSGAELWAYNGAGWDPVSSTDGLGDLKNEAIVVMSEFEGELYLGTFNRSTGAEIWQFNGQRFHQVSEDGFGDQGNSMARCMGVFGGQLYVGTLNQQTGGELWTLGAQRR